MFTTKLNENFDFTKTCRLCLNQTNEFISIFNLSNFKIQYSIIINQCTSLMISENDKLPKILCLECVECLNGFYQFRKLAINSEQRLNDFLTKFLNNFNVDVLTENSNSVKEEELVYDLTDESNVPTFLIKSEENSMDLEQNSEFEDETGIVEEKLEIDENETLNEPTSVTLNFGDETEAFNQEEGSDKEINHPIFNCKSCPQTFTEETDLKNHEETHQNTDPHNSIPSSQLTAYKETNKSDKPYICNLCNKAFKMTSHLKQHKRTHTGEKPYRCKHCGKSFALLCNTKNHERIHSGEKPYSCKQCGKSFNQSSNLKKHELLHTGEKPYVCDVCDKAFIDKAKLKQHGITHTGERRYSCKQCGEFFAYGVSLKRHQEKNHKRK